MKYNSSFALGKAKGIVMSAAAEGEKKRLKMYKEPASCRVGCHHCCSRMIVPTLAEVYAIKSHLMKSGKWHEVKSRIESLKEYETDDFAAWFLMNIKCPILDPSTGKCTAYEVRPLQCSLHFVSSNPSSCDPWSVERLDIKLIDMDDIYDRYTSELEKAFGKYIWNMKLPLHKALLICDKLVEVTGLSVEEVLTMVAKET